MTRTPERILDATACPPPGSRWELMGGDPYLRPRVRVVLTALDSGEAPCVVFRPEKGGDLRMLPLGDFDALYRPMR